MGSASGPPIRGESVRPTQRDLRIAALARQVRELVRRLDAVEAELEATRRANRQAIAQVIESPRRLGQQRPTI